jgi:hypothetical protein
MLEFPCGCPLASLSLSQALAILCYTIPNSDETEGTFSSYCTL